MMIHNRQIPIFSKNTLEVQMGNSDVDVEGVDGNSPS